MKQSKKNKQFIRQKQTNTYKHRKLDVLVFQKPYIAHLILALICLATCIVYAKAIGFGFIYNWDDTGYIINNEYIRSLSFENIKAIFSEFYMHNYHPLTTLSYTIEYALVQQNPWLYHLNNILFHLLNTYLVYRFTLLLLRGKEVPSLIVAALFALHPMHVESVAWISERKDVLYTVFFMLSLISYIKYVRTKKLHYFIYTAIFFVLSCLSKSAAVTLPIVLLAIDYFESRKWTLAIILEKIPLLIISILFGVLAIRSQASAIQDLTPLLTLFERLLIVSYGFVTYLYKSILPIQLSAFYPYPLKINNILPWYFFIMPLIVGFIFLLLWISRKYGKIILFGFLFFIITISLVLQLMPVGGAIIAERYTYVPYLGLFLIIISPILPIDNETISNKSRQIRLLYLRLFIPLLILFCFMSYNRVSYWEDGDKLFSDVIEKYPRFPYAYNNRGFLYFDHYALKVYEHIPHKKEIYIQKAFDDYTKAIQLQPTYVQAYANRAVLLYNTGKPQEALSDFNVLLELDPHHKDGLIGRANTLSTLGMYEEAIPDYNAYIKLKQIDNPKAYTWRGIAHQKTNKTENALTDFNNAIELLPDDFEAYYWKGLVFYHDSNFTEAITYFNKGIQRNSNHLELYSWRGLSYYNIKAYELAIADFNKAIQINPNELSTYINRSLAYNETGAYQQAFDDLIYAAERQYPISRAYFDKLYRLVSR